MVSSMFDSWIVHQRFVILRVCFIWTKLYQLFHESTKKLQHNVCLKVTLAKGKLKKTWKNLPLTEQCICSKVVQTLGWCSFQNKIWNLLDCVSKSDPFRQFSVVILSRGAKERCAPAINAFFPVSLIVYGNFSSWHKLFTTPEKKRWQYLVSCSSCQWSDVPVSNYQLIARWLCAWLWNLPE